MYTIYINHDLESGKNIYTVTGKLIQFDDNNMIISSHDYSHNFNTKETTCSTCEEHEHEQLISLLSLSDELKNIQDHCFDTLCRVSADDITDLFFSGVDKYSHIIEVDQDMLTIKLGTVTLEWRPGYDSGINVCNTDVIVVNDDNYIVTQLEVNAICNNLVDEWKKHHNCTSLVFCEVGSKDELTTDEDLETYNDDGDETSYFFDDKCNVVVSMEQCMIDNNGPWCGIVCQSYSAYYVVFSPCCSGAIVLS